MPARVPVFLRKRQVVDRGRTRYLNPDLVPPRSKLPENLLPSEVSGAYLNLAIDHFIEEVSSQGKSAATKKAREITEAIFDESQYLCPEDTGHLKESADIYESGQGESKEFQIRYQTRYAIYVHEDTTVYHAPPTQAKFLEQAYLTVMASGIGDVEMKSRFKLQTRAPRRLAKRGSRGRNQFDVDRIVTDPDAPKGRNQEMRPKVHQQIGKKPKK